MNKRMIGFFVLGITMFLANTYGCDGCRGKMNKVNTEPTNLSLLSNEQWEQIEKKAVAGDVDALFDLVARYFEGIGVPKNPQKGLEMIQLCAEKGNTQAMRMLASYYTKGIRGCPKDPDKVIFWVNKFLESVMERGSSSELFSTAVALMRGDGVLARDEKLAARFFEKAETLVKMNRCPIELSMLASEYETGRVYPLNKEKALEYYVAAAEAGSQYAMLRLASTYYGGEFAYGGGFTEVDSAEGRRWLERAARVAFEEETKFLNPVEGDEGVSPEWH
jgi:TPR repeat protein